MINAYFVVNDPPGEGADLTFAAALEILPREGEIVSFETGGPAYKVLVVQHHLRGAMRVEPSSTRPPIADRSADEDVPAVGHEASIMVRALADEEADGFIRRNQRQAAARLAPFLDDAV